MQNSATAARPFNNPLFRFIASPRFRWVRHVVFIIIGLILSFKEDIGLIEHFKYSNQQAAALMWFDAGMFIAVMGGLYFVLLVLIPKLLFRSRILAFFGSAIGVAFFIYVASWALDKLLLAPIFPKTPTTPHTEFSINSFLEQSIITGIMVAGITGVQVFKKWLQDVHRLHELQQASMRAELDQLKSQVNPHFLFNTLNNLLVLTKTNPDKASQVLLGLSDLLRYQLYESSRDSILLSKEIAFLHNLLSLEKIRKDDFSYDIEVDGNTDGISIPPFLFIPFVENAIKHGLSAVGHSYVNIDLQVKENVLQFRSENSIPPIKKEQVGGIGLKNVKRRLELLYPGKHTLDIEQKNSTYSVNLSIPL